MAQASVAAIRLHPDDSVAVLVQDAPIGARVRFLGDESGADEAVVAAEAIPYGHKIAVRAMESGAHVIKYGEVMGVATEYIPVGHHVHTHNVRGLETQERSLSRDEI